MEHAIVSAIRFGVEVAVKSTVLLALALALVTALRRYSAASRHMLTTLALAGALAIPLTALWSSPARVAVPLVPEPVVASARMTHGPVVVRETSIARDDSPAKDGKLDANDSAPPSRPASLESATATFGRFDRTAPAVSVPAFRTAAMPEKGTWRLSVRQASALLAIWAAGALLSLARLAFGSWKIRSIARAAEPLCDPEWRAAARELTARLSIPRHVRLVTSPDVAVAMTAGIRRPVLLLHLAARKWPADRRRVVLLHELAHVRRRDWLTFLLAELVVAIYWFHPLAWLARREARTSAERACDDLVLENGTKPSVYAAHLLGIVRSLKPGIGGALPVLAMARPSQFEGRMRAILNPGLQRRGPSRGQFRGAALGLFSAVFILGAVQPWSRCTASAIPAGLVGSGEDLLFAAPRSDTASPPTKTARSAAKHSKKPCPNRSLPPGASDPAASAGFAAASSPERPAASRSAEPPPAADEGDEGIVSAVTGFVRAITEAPPAPKTAAPSGLVLAANGKHHSGSEWYSKGMQLHHDERYDEAISAFARAIEASYREDAATYNIACGYALKGDRDHAFEWLHKAVEAGFPVRRYLSDDDLDSLHGDARWATLRQELRENPSSEEQAARRHANDKLQSLLADPHASGSRFFETGRSLYKSEDYAGSAKAYHRAAELGYRAGTASYNEACSLALNGDKTAALEALQRAVENGFDQPDMFHKDDDLDSLHGERRFQEIRKLAQELEGPSVDWDGHVFRSERVYQWRKAADRAREVAAKYPQYGRVWFSVGYAEIQGDRAEQAIPAFQKALEMGYRKPTTLYDLACAHAKLGQKDKAFDYLFRALEAGFDGQQTIRHDDDLDNLRSDPRYRQALKLAAAKEGEPD